MSDPTVIVEADLANARHSQAIVALLNAYARDPMGRGTDLPDTVQRNVVCRLREHPGALVLLAYQGEEAVGIAVCFVGFSTFAARPLINIHDLAVQPHCRRQGVGRHLLAHVEARARTLGCCKLTLEVREDNLPAQHLYRAVGFAGEGATALFWTKAL